MKKAVLTIALVGSTALAYIDKTQAPMSRERLVSILTDHSEVTQLDQVPAVLPEDFRMNFVLKHGLKRNGERGHLFEKKVSQSSDPLAPRVILFDERTGFSVSYNGGTSGQTAGERLDVMSWDQASKSFKLEQIDFPIAPGQPKLTTSDCVSCHGPSQRPIFAMYPDWPSFYGSDNDELMRKTPVQEVELKDYRQFREQIVPHAPRYSPLYNDDIEKRTGLRLWPSYPYRQDVSDVPTDVSRSFAFRPSLRLGIVYNRLNAQSISKRVLEHPNFPKFGPYFLANLFECAPLPLAKSLAWQARVSKTLGRPAKIQSGRLDYKQMWALFGLKINDVDIRYSYNHEGYANEDARGKIMEVGTIGSYYNSYFDGSATVDELVSASVYTALTSKFSPLKGLATPRGLDEKYSHFAARYQFDATYFKQMDALGKWLAIPYAQEVAAQQHRERFTPELSDQHQRLCQALEKVL